MTNTEIIEEYKKCKNFLIYLIEEQEKNQNIQEKKKSNVKVKKLIRKLNRKELNYY